MSGNQAELRAILSPTAALMIPGGQAVLTGAACGVIGGSLAGMLHWGDSLAFGGLAAGLGFSAGLLHGLAWWRGRVQSIIGEMQAAPAIVYPAETSQLKLSIDWDEGRAGLFDDLNISDDQFITWACGVASGRSLGENHWTGAANPFSKGQYHAFIDRLSFHSVVRQKGKARTSGFELTGKGRAITSEVLRRYGPETRNPYPALQSYNPNR